MSRVVFIEEVLVSYRGPLFDRLNNLYDILVLHGKKATNLKLIEKSYAKYIPVYYVFWQRFVYLSTIKVISKFKPDIIIHAGSPGIISIPVTLLWCKLHRVKFVLHSHGYERHQGFKPYTSFRSLIRLIYLKVADSTLFYTKGRRDYFRNYSKKQLFYANNTLDTERLIQLKERFAVEGKSKLRQTLDMNRHFNIVFIGRLLPDKLLLDMLSATHLLAKEGIRIKAHIIGDGPVLEELETFIEEKKLHNHVKIHGAVFDDRVSGQILYCSDLLVHPGDIGLAVIHGYCFDLPLITYRSDKNGPFHGPEIEYLEDKQTGILVEPYNITALCDAIRYFINDQNILLKYQKRIREKISEELTIDQMVNGYKACINNLTGVKV